MDIPRFVFYFFAGLFALLDIASPLWVIVCVPHSPWDPNLGDFAGLGFTVILASIVICIPLEVRILRWSIHVFDPCVD